MPTPKTPAMARHLAAGLLSVLAFLALCSCAPQGVPAAGVATGAGAALPDPWPPRVGSAYPDLELLDSAGRPLRLSRFAGRVILVEPIGMSCPACNAFAGAQQKGGYGGVTPQGGLPSLVEIFDQRLAGTRLDDPDLVLVHLLLYDLDMGAPDVDDARRWEEHFDVAGFHGLVTVPAADLRSPATYRLIPGFQLIDRHFVLRYDSAGHQPVHDLWRQLLPAIPAFLRES